jgi:hypothetical protein
MGKAQAAFQDNTTSRGPEETGRQDSHQGEQQASGVASGHCTRTYLDPGMVQVVAVRCSSPVSTANGHEHRTLHCNS